MWWADIRGHHGKRWNYEPGDWYMGRHNKKKQCMAYTKLENLIDYYYFNNYLSKSEIVNLNKFIESNYTSKEPVSLTARDSNN